MDLEKPLKSSIDFAMKAMDEYSVKKTEKKKDVVESDEAPVEKKDDSVAKETEKKSKKSLIEAKEESQKRDLEKIRALQKKSGLDLSESVALKEEEIKPKEADRPSLLPIEDESRKDSQPENVKFDIEYWHRREVSARNTEGQIERGWYVVGKDSSERGVTIFNLEKDELKVVSLADFDSLNKKKEVFDPEEELKKIKNGPNEGKKQKITEFKQKLAEQKKGIAEIQLNLEKSIRENPDASIKEYQDSIQTLVDKYKLSTQQESIVRRVIGSYFRTHEAIRKNTEGCFNEGGTLNGEKVYEKLFKRKPEGKVGIILLPATIYLRIGNFIDYAFVYGGMGKKNISKEEIKKAEKSGGCKLNNIGIPGLENAVALEKASGKNLKKLDVYSRQVLIHEEQHVINELISKIFNPEMIKTDNYRQRTEKLTEEQMKDETLGSQVILEDPNYAENNRIEHRVKDEIIAYFKNGDSPEYIRSVFLKPDTIYEYGFNYKDGDKKSLKFSEEYVALVENGILAFSKLLNAGYSKEQVSNILFVEPLSKWNSIIERTTGLKRDEKKDNKYLRKLRGEDLIGKAKKILNKIF